MSLAALPRIRFWQSRGKGSIGKDKVQVPRYQLATFFTRTKNWPCFDTKDFSRNSERDSRSNNLLHQHSDQVAQYLAPKSTFRKADNHLREEVLEIFKNQTYFGSLPMEEQIQLLLDVLNQDHRIAEKISSGKFGDIKIQDWYKMAINDQYPNDVKNLGLLESLEHSSDAVLKQYKLSSFTDLRAKIALSFLKTMGVIDKFHVFNHTDSEDTIGVDSLIKFTDLYSNKVKTIALQFKNTEKAAENFSNQAKTLGIVSKFLGIKHKEGNDPRYKRSGIYPIVLGNKSISQIIEEMSKLLESKIYWDKRIKTMEGDCLEMKPKFRFGVLINQLLKRTS